MDPHLSRHAHRATDELGHNWLGAEHLLVALFACEITGEALRDCGLSREAVIGSISELPDEYHRKRPVRGAAAGAIRFVTADATEVLARAEGLAVGLGSVAVRPEHVLLSLVWHPSSLVAVSILEKHGGTQSRLVDALTRLGVKVPATPPPRRPKWGPTFSVSRTEFEALTKDLRKAGVLYCFNYMDDVVRISVEDRDPGPTLVREKLREIS